MHWQAYSYVQIVKSFLPQYFYQTKAVEFGSACVNYSISELFENPADYFGVDLTSGQGVNIVCDAKTVNLGTGFDVVVSCECFEHNPHFLGSFENMVKHAREGGLVLFTCATTGRAEHGTSRTTPEQSPGTRAVGWDYYKNVVEQDFPKDFLQSVFEYHAFFTNTVSQDLYFIGIKKGSSAIILPTDLITQAVGVHEQLSLQFNRLWQGESELSFIGEIVSNLLTLDGNSLNPYICEHTFPLLLQRSCNDSLVLEQLQQVVTQVLLQFPSHAESLYLKSLMEHKLSAYNISLSYGLRAYTIQCTPKLIHLLINNYYELGLYSAVLKLAALHKTLLIKSPLWIKINVANRLWQLQLNDQQRGELISEICQSEPNCIELNTILCRYNASIGLIQEALDMLEEQVRKTHAPDWVLLDYLNLIEKVHSLDKAIESFLPFQPQVNDLKKFNRFVIKGAG